MSATLAARFADTAAPAWSEPTKPVAPLTRNERAELDRLRRMVQEQDRIFQQQGAAGRRLAMLRAARDRAEAHPHPYSKRELARRATISASVASGAVDQYAALGVTRVVAKPSHQNDAGEWENDSYFEYLGISRALPPLEPTTSDKQASKKRTAERKLAAELQARACPHCRAVGQWHLVCDQCQRTVDGAAADTLPVHTPNTPPTAAPRPYSEPVPDAAATLFSTVAEELAPSMATAEALTPPQVQGEPSTAAQKMDIGVSANVHTPNTPPATVITAWLQKQVGGGPLIRQRNPLDPAKYVTLSEAPNWAAYLGGQRRHLYGGRPGLGDGTTYVVRFDFDDNERGLVAALAAQGELVEAGLAAVVFDRSETGRARAHLTASGASPQLCNRPTCDSSSPHSTLHTPHSTPYTPHSTLHTLHPRLTPRHHHAAPRFPQPAVAVHQQRAASPDLCGFAAPGDAFP